MIVGDKLRSVMREQGECEPECMATLYFQQLYFMRYMNDRYTSLEVVNQIRSFNVSRSDKSLIFDDDFKESVNRKVEVTAHVKSHLESEVASINYLPSTCRKYMTYCFESLLKQNEHMAVAYFLTHDITGSLKLHGPIKRIRSRKYGGL
jgi:hypothetical protein